MKITLNGIDHEIEQKSISYDGIIEMATGKASTDIWSMVFLRKNGKEGSMKRPERIRLDEGLIINVNRTDNS